MGDRANVVIPEQYGDNNQAVVLYTHWGGTELPETLREALARRERWDDAAYLARIVFCHMIGEDFAGETGYGIATRLPDNEYPLLMLWQETVFVVPAEDFQNVVHMERRETYPSISFEAYVAADKRTWENLTDIVVPA